VAAKETLVDATRSIRGRIMGPRSWPIWDLPRWLVAFVSLVVLADVVVLAVGASTLTVHLRMSRCSAGCWPAAPSPLS